MQLNLVSRYRFFLTILFISFFTPSFLRTQTIITFRPQFDDSPRPRNHLSLFRPLKRPRVGLALSGGGARGAAQIGVIKAFEKHNIPIDFISATSMGSIVGGLYASGYTSFEIEKLALQTDWDKLLSFSDTQDRANLPIDQKLIDDWSIFVVRFENLQPVIPHAVSSGQRLTNFLSEEALQALYHPNPSFDDLKIAFRAITTDLISGKRFTIDNGSLAEALRASSTVPLLFNPIERDSMQLIDGGLVTNIPVDVATGAGCDVVVAVNSTSGLRNADELKAPWQTADQIMGIMMQLSNREQLKNADVTITPAIGRHLSSDFKGLDSLILLGFRSAEEQMDSIKYLYERSLGAMDSIASSDHDTLFKDVHVEIVGTGAPDSTVLRIKNEGYRGSLSARQIRRHIRWLYDSGTLRDVIVEVHPETRPVRVVYTLVPNPALRQIEFVGNNLVPNDSLVGEFQPLFNRIIHRERLTQALEDVLRLYRKRGYSLARITKTALETESGTLRLEINEGVIEKIKVQGSKRAEDSFVLREFGLREGDVFEIEKAKQGITNINSTRIFEYVYLEVSFASEQPVLTISLAEFPSQLIRYGMRVDDERKFQATFDVRDENFRGIGTDLGLRLAFGARNGYANLEFKSNKLFSSIFTFSVGGFVNVFNSYLYADDPKETRENHWNRLRVGEYSDVRMGGRLAVGTRLGKLGSATVEWSLQDSRIKNVENAHSLIEHSRLSLVTVGTVIDTRDRVPFARSGVNFKLSYEFSSRNFLSDVGYNGLRFFYESYRSWGERSTFCPRVAFGFADVTMPLGQQFRLGGRQSMFGTREDDRRGRQMLSISLEYLYQLPIQFVFDPYFRVRYDLATISAVPEEIKLSTFRHGVGIELAFDTPLGETTFGAGKSFSFARDLPKNPIQQGPLLLYFTLGYEL